MIFKVLKKGVYDYLIVIRYKTMIPAIIIGVVVLLIIIWIASSYNMLVKARQKVKNAWSQIEVQLQKRFDLIPNLVETVKGYAKHEEGVLEKVTELRTSWANAKTVEEKAEVANQVTGALKTIMAVSENYPDLKANQNFLNLQADLKDIESKIAYSRSFYNDAVTMYNTKVQVFPTNIIAGMFGFKEEALFNAESDEARHNVKVEF